MLSSCSTSLLRSPSSSANSSANAPWPGLAAARARGRIDGRKPGFSAEAQRTARAAELLYKARELSVDDMAQSLRICKVTFYKYLHHRGVARLRPGAPPPLLAERHTERLLCPEPA